MIELYKSADPLISALWIAGGFSLLCWVLSLITKEYSWVDRLWSITPPLFAIHFAGAAGFDDAGASARATDADRPWDVVADAELDDRSAPDSAADGYGFAARPDFRHQIDYIQWWRDNMVI